MSIHILPLLAAAWCIGTFALSACSSGSDEAGSPDAQESASDALRTPPFTRGASATRNNRCVRTTKPCINLLEDPNRRGLIDGDRWELVASNYKPGSSNVRVWIQDVASGATLEYREGVAADSSGIIDVEGRATRVPGSAGGFGPSTHVDHPLQCGTTYRAITSDPVNGVVTSDPMTTAACDVIH